MAIRSVQDRFWSDGWVRKLNPLDRYLFLYLLTNEHSTWCGIYELDISMLAFESGIDERDLQKSMLPKLHPKIIYVDGWVYVPNWIRHHISESGTISPQQQKGINSAFNKIPERIRLKIKEIEKNGYPIDTLSPYPILSSTITSTNTSAPRTKKTTKYHPLTAEVIKAFESIDPKNKTMYGNITQRKASTFLIEEYGIERVTKAISLLPQINQQNLYISQITTPYELQQNWVKLGNAYKKKQNQLKDNQPNAIW
jgi:hypothetical protein